MYGPGAQAARDAAKYDAEDFPPLTELIPLIEARPRTRDGEIFFLAWDVFPHVGRTLKVHDLFRTEEGDTVVYEVIGWVEDSREYWVREFSIHLPDRLPVGDA